MTAYVIRRDCPPPAVVHSHNNSHPGKKGARSPLTEAMQALAVDEHFDIATRDELAGVNARRGKLAPKKFATRPLGKGKGWRVWRVA